MLFCEQWFAGTVSRVGGTAIVAGSSTLRGCHVDPSRKAREHRSSDHGGRRRAAASRLRFRRPVADRSLPDDGRFPQRRSRPNTLAAFPGTRIAAIETITYVLAGTVEHGDSLGNRGLLGAGDVQWMTAGSGIMHQEMPKGDSAGRMHGFQLWANLPSSLKMTAPRYQDVKSADIPVVVDDDGTAVRVHLRRFLGQGAARSTAWPPSRSISTSRCRRARRSACPSTPTATPSPTSSPAPGRSATRRKPFGVRARRK